MVTKSNGVILGKTSLRGNTKCIHFLLFSFVFLCFLLFSSAFFPTKSNDVILGKTSKIIDRNTPLLLVARYCVALTGGASSSVVSREPPSRHELRLARLGPARENLSYRARSSGRAELNINSRLPELSRAELRLVTSWEQTCTERAEPSWEPQTARAEPSRAGTTSRASRAEPN